MKILLLSDIHGNYPALSAIETYFQGTSFAAICNCGDSLVYAPFPNETLHWLRDHQACSILGNTDKKVKKLLLGKPLTKPKNAEKRIMYTWTAEHLEPIARDYLFSLENSYMLTIGGQDICLFHGSPEHPHEFLFADTERRRFEELAAKTACPIIITGHSHSPYHKIVGTTHFINPGSVGRMFDANPAAACAILTLDKKSVQVHHYRINWPVERMLKTLELHNMPEIYQSMYIQGKKLN
ncbi:MAG: metallophosphatase family protein [Proteobacteria bacterium]|nr:metallophosphatase family protein [Pseudomonadota bacterium]MBU1057057.1 metallophosphatase family protein [Pseudomonadota bacterium]